MSEVKAIVQSRSGHTSRFLFGDEEVTFTSGNLSGDSTFSLHYESINLNKRYTRTIHPFRGNANMILYFGIVTGIMGMCLIEIPLMIKPPSDIAWVIAIIIAGAWFLSIRYIMRKTLAFTMLQTDNGPLISIIQDKNHDEIFQRIKSGWIARLRKLHLAVNVENSPGQEGRKFKWLLDQGVISEAEYHGAIARLSQPSGLPDDARAAAHLQ